jgi:pimeloyl-ACP methyl ester carboxylesterase
MQASYGHPREETNMSVASPAVTEREQAQVTRANASTSAPVVFVHGLWLLPSSWDRWAAFFEENGFVALQPGWPDDPETVAEAKAHPEVFAGKGIGEIADHHEAVIRELDRKPVIIGHSFGGLLTQILAGRGLAKCSVAISPAPFRGVLPLPVSALRAASVALKNPANWNRAVPLTYDQFRYSFANAVGEDEAKELYTGYRCRARASRSSRLRPRTSTRGRRRRSTRRRRSAGRCSSSPPTPITPCRGRSQTRRTRSRRRTAPSRRSRR